MTYPRASAGSPRMHLPALAAALLVMLAGSIYPPLMANAAGRAEHGVVLAACWAMCAGLVRGVGFVPRAPAWRWLLSGWACGAALALAVVLKLAP